jgi:hypothetical protein
MLIIKPCEYTCPHKKQTREYQACEWQPEQPPSFKFDGFEKNCHSKDAADQKGNKREQPDISATHWSIQKQLTGADLAAKNIRDKRQAQTCPR